MTLQEKIQKKAEEYRERGLTSVFLEGAEFVLNNQWISVDEDLPCNHEELIITGNYYKKETINVITIDKHEIIDNYMVLCDGGKWEWKYGVKPYYWMPIPELPKRIGDKIMTKEEYQKKINELKEQKYALNAQIEQVKNEFRDSLLRELEEQGITPGTKVSVKTKSRWQSEESETETYFFGVGIEYGDVTHIFHKIKKDGTMSQVNQYIGGQIISIHKI